MSYLPPLRNHAETLAHFFTLCYLIFMEKETTPRDGIFISYSHDNKEHANRILALANRLIKDGIDCTIDQYEPHPPEGWPQWMSKQLEKARFVLIICTQTYLDRWNGTEPDGVGKGVKWEANLVRNYIYREDSRIKRFIPVVFRAGDTPVIPMEFQGHTFYCLDSAEGYDELYRRLTSQPSVKKPGVGKKKTMPSSDIAPMTFPGEGETEKKPEAPKEADVEVEVDLSRLPVTGEFLLGREGELDFLDRAWAQGAAVVTVVAMGGVGKTALVNRWLEGLKKENFRGARRVWAWSFYSQGSGEGRQVSADTFMDAALRDFGDSDPGAGSPWDRGVRLAKLVRRQKTLLLLDGLEPMQFPPGPQYGGLKDQPLQALLRELAFHNPGLCVVSTRVKVKNLSDKVRDYVDGTAAGANADEDKPVWRLCLDRLEPGAGAELLRLRGVRGSDRELGETSERFDGHALALNLLGTYLSEVHDGDIRCAGEVDLLSEETDESGHAGRVMAKYETYLSGAPELEILYLLGFFDRPADGKALAALSTPDPLPDTPAALATLTSAQWKKALARLRHLGLISSESPTPSSPSLPSLPSLDSHPLVREYFGRRLRATRPGAYTTGHRRLYEYYQGLPEKELPETLREMEPLYTAISHGCAAWLHSEVYENVYHQRITRGDEYYSLHKLSAFGSDLAALSNFFREPWKQPVDGLSDPDQTVVLGISGYLLRALGRLWEAAQPMEAALEQAIQQEDWENAAKQASTLSQLWLCLGDVVRATGLGRESVTLADRSGDEFHMESKRTTHADALHQAGDRDRAERLFQDAEARQNKRQPRYEYLCGLAGFRYCDLLLGRGRSDEVRKRAKTAIKIAKENRWPMDIALAQLSLGRAHWQASRSSGSGSAQTTRQYLDQAVDRLRKAEDQEMICRGLLARGGFLRWAGQRDAARHDLEEAREIGERGDMKLWLTDYHLENCRLELDEKNMEKAKVHLDNAKRLVEETGYHRRDGEVEELEGKMKRN